MSTATIPRDQRRTSFDIPSLVQLACSYSSRITLTNSQGQFDAKSIMGMMSFDFFDQVLRITAEGPDARAAVDALSQFIVA